LVSAQKYGSVAGNEQKQSTRSASGNDCCCLQPIRSNMDSVPHPKRLVVCFPSSRPSSDQDVVPVPNVRPRQQSNPQHSRNEQAPPVPAAVTLRHLPDTLQSSTAPLKPPSWNAGSSGYATAANRPQHSAAMQKRPKRAAVPSKKEATSLCPAPRSRCASPAFIVTGCSFASALSAADTPELALPKPKPFSPISYHSSPTSSSRIPDSPPPLSIARIKLLLSSAPAPPRPVLPLNSISGWQRVSKSLSKPPSPPALGTLPLLASETAWTPLEPDACYGADAAGKRSTDGRAAHALVCTTPRENSWQEDLQAVSQGAEVKAAAALLSPSRRLSPEVPEQRPRSRGGGWLSAPNCAVSSGRAEVCAGVSAVQLMASSTSSAAASLELRSSCVAPRHVTLQHGSFDRPAASPSHSASASPSALSPELVRMCARAASLRARGLQTPWTRCCTADEVKDRNVYLEHLVRDLPKPATQTLQLNSHSPFARPIPLLFGRCKSAVWRLPLLPA
jgi:hypothetical protein